jgi:hypothetical protein
VNISISLFIIAIINNASGVLMNLELEVWLVEYKGKDNPECVLEGKAEMNGDWVRVFMAINCQFLS